MDKGSLKLIVALAPALFAGPARAQLGEYSPFVLTLDSLRLSVAALDTLATRLGATQVSSKTDAICFERSRWYGHVYSYCFGVDWWNYPTDTLVIQTYPWGTDTLRCKRHRRFASYSFEATSPDVGGVSGNISAFLNSAYHQLLVPGYAEKDSLFRPPPPQTQAGLWPRALLSCGWAAQYTERDNPFIGQKGLRPWLGYLFDGAIAALTVIAVVKSEDSEKALRGLAVAKTGHAAVTLAIFTPFFSREVAETARMRESGFRFPVGLRP